MKLKYKLREITYWPRQFIEGLKNLIIWFPIIWKDRQWDHSFFLAILEKKLHLMDEFFENGAIIVDSKKVAKEIRIARMLITRLRKDEYEDPLYEKLEKKWGETEMKFEDRPNGLCELFIEHENVKTPEDEEKYRKELKRNTEHTIMLRRQDKEYFGLILRKYLDSWWE
jgi:hypothetical protein